MRTTKSLIRVYAVCLESNKDPRVLLVDNKESDQSLRCMLRGLIRTKALFMRTTKSLCALRVNKDTSVLLVDNKESDQSLRCTLRGLIRTKALSMRTTKSLCA